MDITNTLTYNNLSIPILDVSSNSSISGWSASKNKYTTEKIISIKPTKVNNYYILNGIKFHINSELLIKANGNIQIVSIKDLYDRFLNNEVVSVLNYKLEDIPISNFEFEERTSVRNNCTFLSIVVYGNSIFLPYSEHSILIRAALFI